MVYVLKTVSILGSTGSVGKNTLEVISSLKDNLTYMQYHVIKILHCCMNRSLNISLELQ